MTEETAMTAQKMEGEGGTAKEPERLQEDTVTENAKTGDDIAYSAIDPEEDALNGGTCWLRCFVGCRRLCFCCGRRRSPVGAWGSFRSLCSGADAKASVCVG